MKRRAFKKSLKTDFEVLKYIYEAYFDDYLAFDVSNVERSTKIYVPIDIDAAADKLNFEADLLFIRLYSYLNDKYGANMNENAKSPLFLLRVGKDVHCIHFPLLASVLADLEQKRRHESWTLYLSIAAFLVSVFGVFFSL
jgi:hypothetical protein